MVRNIKGVVWFLLTLAGCVFTMTILGTVQGAPRIGWFVIITLLVLQLTGLFFYLHVKPDYVFPKLLKAFLFLLHLSLAGVIGCFGFSVFSLANEYHNPVSVVKGDQDKTNMVLEETDDLYIMYPGYTTVEFVVGDRPKRYDQSITICTAATFQRTYNLSYSKDDLPGTFVTGGKKYTGYELDGLGAFAFYDGTYHFANEEEAEAEIEQAYKAGGCAFQQYMIIDDGEIVLIPSKEYRCLRVLAELDGKLCVIDTKYPTYYKDFANELQSLGVTHALYMDMGSGWNYSWYRDNNGADKTLIGMRWPFSHNWLTFRME